MEPDFRIKPPLRTITSTRKLQSVIIYLVDATILVKTHPEWDSYFGSHHWGMKTSYIPVNEIWISNRTPKANISKVMLHEIIERPIMGFLELKEEWGGLGLTAEEAWAIGHPVAEKLSEYLMVVPQLGEEILVGGKGDNTQDSDFDSEQMEIGEKVEMEHVENNPNKQFAKQVAREIARDHLTEFPKYYDYLNILESLMEVDKDEGGDKWLQELTELLKEALP